MFYLDPAEIQGDSGRFSPEESHHMSGVLHLRGNELIEATDGEGKIYAVQLAWREGGCWIGRILSCNVHEAEAPLPVSIALPCLKSDRWQMALEAACEMGVDEVWPVDFKRAALKWTANRLAKARRRAIEVLKQSGGSRLTRIREPLSLWETLHRGSFTGIWLAHPEGTPLSSISAGALLIVGPEAGFNPEEEEEVLSQFGVKRFRLGSRRLRSEVALVAALSQAALKLAND